MGSTNDLITDWNKSELIIKPIHDYLEYGLDGYAIPGCEDNAIFESIRAEIDVFTAPFDTSKIHPDYVKKRGSEIYRCAYRLRWRLDKVLNLFRDKLGESDWKFPISRFYRPFNPLGLNLYDKVPKRNRKKKDIEKYKTIEYNDEDSAWDKADSTEPRGHWTGLAVDINLLSDDCFGGNDDKVKLFIECARKYGLYLVFYPNREVFTATEGEDKTLIRSFNFPYSYPTNGDNIVADNKSITRYGVENIIIYHPLDEITREALTTNEYMHFSDHWFRDWDGEPDFTKYYWLPPMYAYWLWCRYRREKVIANELEANWASWWKKQAEKVRSE